MTLILARASGRYMLQVADRLVTQGPRPYDPLANKTILYCANNGIVAMSYTGMAFFGDIPTDQWIAEVLIGDHLDRDLPLPVFGPGPMRSLDIGRALIELRQAFDNAPVAAKWRKQWAAQSFDVCIVGWQWTSRRTRPIIASLSKPRDSTVFQLEYDTRYWYYERRGLRFKVGAAPAENVGSSAIRALTDKLRNCSPDEAEMILVGAVRDVSRRIPQVGPHCMSVLIMPPNVGCVRVRYLPLGVPANASLKRSDGKTLSFPVAFSPWIVGLGMISAPFVLSCGMEFDVGLYKVEVEAPRQPGPVLFFARSQQRPAPPS